MEELDADLGIFKRFFDFVK